MKPEEITLETESIARIFTKDLRTVYDPVSFDDFLDEWQWCLEKEVRRLSGSDWVWIKPLLDEMKREDVFPEEKHTIPMKLAMPAILFAITHFSSKLELNEGIVFYKLREIGMITEDYQWNPNAKPED